MLLENMAYPEVERYLKEKDIILVPIGSTEQHSPYGLIGTDFLCAQAVARQVGSRMDLLVAPTVPMGFSAHHMAFCGTVSLRPATLIALVVDITRCLLAHGFRRIVFVNGHGGNVHPIRVAFETLKSEDAHGLFELVSWYELEEVRKLTREMFGAAEGMHATPGEVSVTRALRPEAFESVPNDPAPLNKSSGQWPLNAAEFKLNFPDGRMESAPWLSSSQNGRAILDRASAAVERKVADLMRAAVH